MKVVFDTNVFVSGIHWGGASKQAIRQWFIGRFLLISSPPIIQELAKTLMSFKIPLENEEIEWWVSLILAKAIIVVPTENIHIVMDDPDDNKFFEAAIAGDADYIVSQDKHLLRIGEYKQVKVLTPEDFLKIL